METGLLHGLDAQQRLAVETDAAPLAIIAAAGSGKTTVLTRRIARRILDGSAHPKHVLALTFTREAAAEMRRRLRRLDVRDAVEIGTFHAVALRLLRDRAAANGTAPPVVAPDRVRLMREVLTETRISIDPMSALVDVDWARARLVEPRRYGEAARVERRRGTIHPDAFPTIVERYEALKRRRGVVDFDDMLHGLLVSMQRDRTFGEIVRWRFRHLFVDEAQDMNPLQHALLAEIRGTSPDVCLVGDPRQAIYGFNGSDPSMLTNVEERLRGVTVVSLTGNYRCSPQIVRAGAAALGAAGMGDDSESRRPDGPSIRLSEAADEKLECAAVARAVGDLVRRHGASRVAVLARTNEQLGALARALEAAGVPTARTAGRSPLDRALGEAYRCENRDTLAEWAQTILVGDEVDPVRHRVAVETDRFLMADERGTFRAWVDARQPFDDLEPDTDAAVALLTFHAAKGREWAAVVVTGVEEGLVPHSSAFASAQREEEARLLYVALTRASDELLVTWSRERRRTRTKESPFLAPVRASTLADEPAAPPSDVRRRAPAPDPLEPLRTWRRSVARAAGIDERGVCSDATLRTMLKDPPRDVDDVAALLGVSRAAAERLAPRLLSLIAERAPA